MSPAALSLVKAPAPPSLARAAAPVPAWDLAQTLTHCRDQLNAFLSQSLPARVPGATELSEGMRYAVLGGGKRVRGTLCMLAAELFAGPEARARVLTTAAGIECIHAASLICDDLPALDDDAVRHGLPTLHVLYDDALAILASNALFAHAVKLVAAQARTADPRAVAQVLERISSAAGCAGMAGGELEDLRAEGRDVSLAELERIHARKTGALIEAAAQSGALLGGAGPEDVAALGRYARALGLAFQVVDDVLDASGTAERLGKPVGNDVRRRKASYVSLLGLEEARREARRQGELARAALEPFGAAAGLLASLVERVLERDH